MTKEDFNGPRVLVDFWASWCGPCKMMKPRIEKFATDNPDIKVIFCNVDEESNIAKEYKCEYKFERKGILGKIYVR